MSKETFSPEQRAAMTELIKYVDPYKHAGVFGQAIYEISKRFGLHPLQEIEDILRTCNSDTYLLAIPMADTDEFDSKMPHSNDRLYPYYLWIGVNGSEEMEEKMREIETTAETNKNNLASTGMLVPKAGSNLSLELNSPFN